MARFLLETVIRLGRIWAKNDSSPEAPAKRSQDFNATCRNIVGSTMLRVFGHPVMTCYDVLRHVTTCWVLLAQICKICGCCSCLARFVQQCCAQACALVRFSTRNMSQHVAIGGQTRATCTCCTQQCCDRLAGTCKCSR